MGNIFNGKYPRGGTSDPHGGWPDITNVPGTGAVVKQYHPAMSEQSAAHSADQTEDAFGVGRALQRGAPDSRAGKIPQGGDV